MDAYHPIPRLIPLCYFVPDLFQFNYKCNVSVVLPLLASNDSHYKLCLTSIVWHLRRVKQRLCPVTQRQFSVYDTIWYVI